MDDQDDMGFERTWTPLERLLDDVVTGLADDCNQQASRIRDLESAIRRHRHQTRIMAIQHMDSSGRIDDIGLRMLDESCRELWLLISEDAKK